MFEDAVLVCQQFIGTAFLSDLAVRKNNDFISSLHGTHAVGDDQDGLSFKKPRQRALHLRFVLHVQRGCRLIQQDDGRVFQERTGDGNTLTLAAGELCSIFADGRRITLRQFFHELIAAPCR